MRPRSRGFPYGRSLYAAAKLIEKILPDAVASAEAFDDPPDAVLYPGEAEVISRAVDKRRREFRTVRHCARQALRQLGLPPTPVLPGKRGPGRPPTYGKKRISLAKRAGQRRGWLVKTFVLYRASVTKQYKTFLATYRPAGGLIRVVLVKEDDGSWRAYFCTHADATVEEILEAVADRSALEQVFHDVKEVHGVGQAQTRNYWSNVAVYHVKLWWHTLIELWAWDRSAKELVDRQLSPWDDAERRPSHADKRNALRRKCLEEEFQAGAALATVPRKIQTLWRRVVRLVA